MRLRAHAALAAATLILIPIAARADHIQVDYNHHADFHKYHTYCWKSVRVSNPLDEARIKRAVNQQLQKHGWEEDAQNCAVTVMATDTVHNEKQAETYYDGLGGGWGMGWGWGGWGWGPGWFWGPGDEMGNATTTTRNVPRMDLMVDLFSTRSKQLLWRGVLHGTLTNNAQTNRQHIYGAVAHMFNKFPPKTEKG